MKKEPEAVGFRDRCAIRSHAERVGNGNVAKRRGRAYIADAFSTSVTLQRLVPTGAGGNQLM